MTRTHGMLESNLENGHGPVVGFDRIAAHATGLERPGEYIDIIFGRGNYMGTARFRLEIADDFAFSYRLYDTKSVLLASQVERLEKFLSRLIESNGPLVVNAIASQLRIEARLLRDCKERLAGYPPLRPALSPSNDWPADQFGRRLSAIDRVLIAFDMSSAPAADVPALETMMNDAARSVLLQDLDERRGGASRNFELSSVQRALEGASPVETGQNIHVFGKELMFLARTGSVRKVLSYSPHEGFLALLDDVEPIRGSLQSAFQAGALKSGDWLIVDARNLPGLAEVKLVIDETEQLKLKVGIIAVTKFGAIAGHSASDDLYRSGFEGRPPRIEVIDRAIA